MSGLSRRQAQLARQELAQSEYAHLLDLFFVVDIMKSSTDIDLRRTFKRDQKRGFTYIDMMGPNGKNRVQYRVVDLLQKLPVHLMACLCFDQPFPSRQTKRAKTASGFTTDLSEASLSTKSQMEYIGSGLRLLFYLSWAASKDDDPSIRLGADETQALESAEYQASVVELVAFTLITVAGPLRGQLLSAARDPARADEALDIAGLVPFACNVLVHVINAAGEDPENPYPFDPVIKALLVHRHGGDLMDALFDATAAVLAAERAALIVQNQKLDHEKMCYNAGAAMEVVISIAEHPLFHHAMLARDASASALMRMVSAAMALGRADGNPPIHVEMLMPSAPGPDVITTELAGGNAELLIARSLLLMTAVLAEEHGCEAFRAAITSVGTKVKAVAQCFAADALALSNDFMRVSASPSYEPFGKITGGGSHLAMNALRATTTVLSLPGLLKAPDNFVGRRAGRLLASVIAILYVDERQFMSRWCYGKEAMSMFLAADQYVVGSKRPTMRQRAAQLALAVKVPAVLTRLTGAVGTQHTHSDEQVDYARTASVELTVLLAVLIVQMDKLASEGRKPTPNAGADLAKYAKSHFNTRTVEGARAFDPNAALARMQANIGHLVKYVGALGTALVPKKVLEHLRLMVLDPEE